jgi:pyruvate ferredoxin oxidoreductase delta subunit
MNNLKKSKELPIGGILPAGTSKKIKTGTWRSMVPIWDSKKCIHCMKCVNYCPENCIPIKIIKTMPKRLETDFNYCKGCGICANVCPVGAIKMVPENEAKNLIKKGKAESIKTMKKKLTKELLKNKKIK